MKKTREIESLEFWAVRKWQAASERDGAPWGPFGQYSEWRVVKEWLWGYEAAAKSKAAKDAAEFLSELATVRGSLQ
jgi:hypothetical protein